jgi:hypothetical protein
MSRSRECEEVTVSARRRGDEPGPEERQELAIEEEIAARDEVRDAVAADDLEEDDGEETVDEMLELDQTELDDLGLTLDDPHQPVDE